ncbi:PREDICTED: rho guanine nucleotide exchange factor 19 isoform X2 [Poecilia mexicana]|uniref:DH domain-containing protein n=1 Tax=Poecilia mexicana TaxID=48701 RepID=A0A3B3WXS7_9TELE|nr:PREDICTED: rho guanine nucleotide exchange factor 19 isoform X2 [Poecilia mexicana]
MASFNVRADGMYGFKNDVTDDLEQGNELHIGFSNLENDLQGSGDNTDLPEDYSHLDLSSALKCTKHEQAWDLLSPLIDQHSCPKPQEDDSSLPEEENLEEGEASSDEEFQSVTFQSKYISIFPLYQDYSLQAIGDGIQKLKDGLLSDLGKSESFYGLFSHLRAGNHLEAESPVLTPDSTSPTSPAFFHGRRSALRRHSHFGVVSPHQSADSISTESCSQGRASTLSISKRLEFEDPSPSQPPSIRLTSCTLWQDLEKVKASGLPNILTPKEIGLQESMFELIGSEVSYLKSLGVLVNHFYASKVLKKTMSTMEHHTLFCNIRRVMEANTKQQNRNFVYALKKLERDPVCQKQGLKSFLILPFQRITRMKLLLESILKLTEPDSEAASNLSKAIKGIHEIVLECDQKVEKMKRLEELVRLETLMDFDDIKLVPLVKSTRFLVLHGPLDTVVTYGSKLSTVRIYLHLFNDLLIISSKKYERFAVLDYAVFPEHVTVLANKVLGLPVDSFILNLSQSQIGPPTAIILIASKSFEKEVWIKALSNK